MKHRDLVQKLTEFGFVLERTSGRHEIYVKDGTEPIAVPHHKEINELTAKSILKKAENAERRKNGNGSLSGSADKT